MTQNGTPILDVRIRNATRAGISYSTYYEEWDACVSMGLDLDKWERNDYQKQFKERVIAFHRLRTQVSLVSSDESIKQANKGRRR